MNTIELAEKLNALGYQRRYTIGKRVERRDALICEDSVWKILGMEKGNEYVYQVFDDEETACAEFFKLITRTSPGIPAELYFGEDGYPRNYSGPKK
ncbi:hypothetical protein [Roseinatronobacter alkalisoli]|uniref:KTSC domain-containing protein n=1 Tax=Roseinatronobacter alkalisoli TaxID=3028235 RepID=A0ABT5TFR3_9RHOB|nr:hypothetical protein [Roseinatronobacter sp. HJB301]MDD7973962.1 hypothetical protein [Roseinatronobacter sp. HJB301]